MTLTDYIGKFNAETFGPTGRTVTVSTNVRREYAEHNNLSHIPSAMRNAYIPAPTSAK